MIILTFLYLLFFIRFSHELNNGLGRTPQMGKINDLDANVRFFYDIHSKKDFGCKKPQKGFPRPSNQFSPRKNSERVSETASETLLA